MANATPGSVINARRFTVMVPPDWTILPLNPANRDKRIAGLVANRMGKEDRLAHIRRLAIMDLRKAAANAADRGAFFAATQASSSHGLPLSASATALMLPEIIDASGNVLTDTNAVEAHLAHGAEDDQADVIEHSVVPLRVGQAARVRRRTGSGLQALDGQEVLAETLHFYVPLPEAHRALALLFSTPILSLADNYMRLFDAMAATARWIAGDAHQVAVDSDAAQGNGS